jgi:hypothetical protein
MQQSGGWGKPNTKLVGENHPNGAIFNYYIKNSAETDTVTLDIMEMDGTLIQRYASNAKANKFDPGAPQPLKVTSGGNRFVWNMRYPGFKTFKGMVLYSSPNVGPKAVPGNYKVKLTYNGKSTEKEFSIVKDPRLPNTEEDYTSQLNFLISVREEVTRANMAITDIRSIKTDLQYLKGKISGDKEMKDLIEDFESKLTVIENTIHMTKNQSRQDPLNYGIRINNRLAFLMADSQRGDYPPTDQSLQFFEEIKKELAAEMTALNQLLEEYIGTINSKVSDNKIKMISFK